jgi:hypothetical protein
LPSVALRAADVLKGTIDASRDKSTPGWPHANYSSPFAFSGKIDSVKVDIQ